jgi:hypothetical protein
MCLDAAENVLEAYLGYYPLERACHGIFDGQGNSFIQLRSKPVVLHSISINGAAMPLSEFFVNNEFVYYRYFPAGVANVAIEYTGGFPEEAMPDLLKITVLRLAALLETESGGNIGVTSKSFADSGTRTFVNNTDYNRYLLPVSSYRLLRF